MTTSGDDNSALKKALSERDLLRSKVKELESSLSESEGTLKAILNGEVDAVIVNVDGKDQIYTLKGADEPYRALFEQMSEGAVTISEDSSILYSNRSFAKAVGIPLERIIGSKFVDCLAPADRKVLWALMKESKDRPSKSELYLRLAYSRLLPVKLSISHLSMAKLPTYSVLVTDLSERLAAEAALRKANEELEEKVKSRTSELEDAKVRLETLLDQMPVAVVMVEPPDGRVIYVNKEVSRQLRGPTKAVCDDRDLPLYDLPLYTSFHLDGRQYSEEELPLNVAMRTGKAVLNEIIQFERLDGTRGYSNANAVPIRDSKGNLTAIIGLRFDISDQIIAQQKLARSNSELQQFAYVASHDLQEPLRMVINYVGLLNKRYSKELDDQSKEYLVYINEGAERMRQLINDLLQYSRVDIQVKPFEQVDMNIVVAEVLSSLQVAIKESGANIEARNLPMVWADKVQIGQVVQNLVANSMKFNKAKTPRILIDYYQTQIEWVFTVEDNGIGIDPRNHEKIFQMFQRLHSRDEYPGSGIGLPISKKIVERHGGRIWIQSELGEGSTFFFSIAKGLGGGR
ncbi:MAG TPA: ATP-binding protein [Methanomassiliicoccales archaeon]|nr:ATP-binding protein [Methanomassiliicoccales archaeon]